MFASSGAFMLLSDIAVFLLSGVVRLRP